MHCVCDTPAPAELHRSNVHLVHFRGDDRAVALLDERARNAAPAELARESEPDWSTADDQNATFLKRGLHSEPACRACSNFGVMPSCSRNLGKLRALLLERSGELGGDPGLTTAPNRGEPRRDGRFGENRADVGGDALAHGCRHVALPEQAC